MSSKRSNLQNMEVILVGTGDQAVKATGNLVGTSTALGIANGQLGILSADHNSTVRAYNDFLQAGDTAAQVSKIKVVQGTPASADITTADDGFQAGHRSRVESGVIHANQIRSISSMTCKVPTYSTDIVHTVPAPKDNSLYAAYIKLSSVVNDRDFGDNQEVVYVNYATPDYTALATVDPTDHLLQNFVFNMQKQSKLVRVPNTPYGYGSKDFIAFGLNIAGTVGGTVIGTIVAGDVIPIIQCGTQVINYVATTAFVNTVNQWIACDTITAATTIEVIDISTAGEAAVVDSFAIMGLDTAQALAYDDIEQVKTRVGINLAECFLLDLPVVDCCVKWPSEGTGQGRKWYIQWKERARMNIFTPEIFPSGDFIIEPPSYIDTTLDYTSYIIDYWDFEETMTRNQNTQKRLIILLPCAITAPGADAATGYTTATTATTTVANLNSILGAWLGSITGNVPEYLAEATAATPFV